MLSYVDEFIEKRRFHTLKRSAVVVTRLDRMRRPVLERRSLMELLQVLCARAGRLIESPELCERIKPVFVEFMSNIASYFIRAGKADNYLMCNLATALVCSDDHGHMPAGIIDYSTLIRRLNPSDPDERNYFIIGREGSVDDPDCPLKALENQSSELAAIPEKQLHMYYAFYHARSQDTSRNAPRIPVADFVSLVPDSVFKDEQLEEGFLDVCFSDGAWELYQLTFE